MDPLNIIVGLNIIAIFGANIGAAKKGIRSHIGETKERPKGFFQTVPPLLATLLLVMLIIALFQVGTFTEYAKWQPYRLAGLLFYLVSSWTQVALYRRLGDNYSQDIVIFKKHKLIQDGLYKYIRHPYYLFQILSDLGAAVATLSFLVLPLAVIEIPILIKRALIEEGLLEKHFPEQFKQYRKKAGFFLPFIG